MTIFAKGYDFSWGRPSVASLKAVGAAFVVRYVYPHTQATGGKNLTKGEATTYTSGGLKVVSNYESHASRALDGFAAGAADAVEADAQHRACGGGPTDPIIFSVDIDITNSSQMAAVGQYFKGVASKIGLSRTGAYGEYEVIKYLLDNKLIKYAWQAYAWSHGLYDQRSQLAQDKNGIKVGGADVDYDTAHAADYGQWGISHGATIPPVTPPHKPTTGPVKPIKKPVTVVYVVQRGDTLSGIAQRYKTTVAAIVKANGIKNANLIYVGQRLAIPGATTAAAPPKVAAKTTVYVVRAGDTLSGIASRYKSSWQRLAAVNGIKNPNLIFIGQKLTIR